jgi:hypothetical protein
MLSPKQQLPSIKKVEKLTPDQASECSRHFPIFNEITFEYLLSKDHTFREKGISIINNVLEETDA